MNPSPTAFVTQAGCKDIAASKDDLLAEIDLASETLRKLRQKVEVTFHAKQLGQSASEPVAATSSELGGKAAWVGKLQYDWVANSLLLPSGIRHPIPKRFVEVLRLLLGKDPGNRKAKRSFATMAEIGLQYRGFQLRRDCPTIDEETFKERLQTISDDKIALKKHAHQCKRSLARWALGIGIDGDLLLECKRRQDTYCLGQGWHQKKPVVNQASVCATKEINDAVEYHAT